MVILLILFQQTNQFMVVTVNGGFKINKVWGSYATTVRAEVG